LEGRSYKSSGFRPSMQLCRDVEEVKVEVKVSQNITKASGRTFA
jgi:hypothetical protein